MRLRHALAALALSAGSCSAIVIVPPIVYVASLSLLAVFLKLLVAFFSWLAVSRLASRGLFKKPVASILPYLLTASPKFIVAFCLAAVLTLIAKPVASGEVLLVSAATALMTVAFAFLSEFRGIMNSKKRLMPIASLVAFGLLVFVICYASVWTSVSETVRVKPEAAGDGITVKGAIRQVNPGFGMVQDARGAP